MPAMPPGLLPLLFAALALAFAALAFRARHKTQGEPLAGRAQMRVAVVFALVSLALLLLARPQREPGRQGAAGAAAATGGRTATSAAAALLPFRAASSRSMCFSTGR